MKKKIFFLFLIALTVAFVSCKEPEVESYPQQVTQFTFCNECSENLLCYVEMPDKTQTEKVLIKSREKYTFNLPGQIGRHKIVLGYPLYAGMYNYFYDTFDKNGKKIITDDNLPY